MLGLVLIKIRKSRQAVVVHLAEKAPPEVQRQHPLTYLKLTSTTLQFEQSPFHSCYAPVPPFYLKDSVCSARATHQLQLV